MAETTVTATVTHRIHTVADYIDLDGSEWQLRECPTCGHRDRVHWEPFKCVTLKRGDKSAAHVQFTVPTMAELRGMVGGDAFEDAVDQAMIDGEPLLSLGMGGQAGVVSIPGHFDNSGKG